MRKGFEKFLVTLLRLSMGWIFLWVFVDKLWGLGYSTPKGEGWLTGVSPTSDFLSNSSQASPFTEVFQAMAGQSWVDWLFMITVAGVGVTLILGVMIRLAGVIGALLSLLIFLAIFPPEDNPFITFHIIYILVLLLLSATPSGDWLGLGKWWSKTRLVKGFPFLK
jgi:thiosulfate dehydrogenase [quinone] large subunit